jgi:hypothetical protein
MAVTLIPSNTQHLGRRSNLALQCAGRAKALGESEFELYRAGCPKQAQKCQLAEKEFRKKGSAMDPGSRLIDATYGVRFVRIP